LVGFMGNGTSSPRMTSLLCTRFKYVIGIGVGAGAYVLAKFAVSLPAPNQNPNSTPELDHSRARDFPCSFCLLSSPHFLFA
jgi:hypothetical protein